MDEFLDQIRRGGVALTPELAAAFAGVPREVFVPDGFRRNDGGWARPSDDDFLTLVYQDDALVTKVRDNLPVSSTSQPSLMALMIEALDVRPGRRILEIGAGTGYNAALLASLGATVTSVDVQEDVARRARQALINAHIQNVRVEHGDGYAGHPGGRFDRVIVTVGVAGLSPLWIDQLEPDGVVVAPVDHAGMHPVLVARRVVGQGLDSQRPDSQRPAQRPVSQRPDSQRPVSQRPDSQRPVSQRPDSQRPGSQRPESLADLDGSLTARLVCHAGFMTAAGPLSAAHPGSWPAAAGARELGELTEFAPARFDPPLDPVPYRDLWYAAGVWNHHASHAAVPGVQQSSLALLDDDRQGAAVVLPDGSVRVTASSPLGPEAVEIVDRWLAAGRPGMRDWRIGFALTGDPDAPIWAPSSWSLSDQDPDRN
jgi:protein-L-isoaspartate(D-aspartate) O-methyltransferase